MRGRDRRRCLGDPVAVARKISGGPIHKRTRGTLMSRGLGKLQRHIKALIEAQDERYRQECDADPDGEREPSCSFWLYWSDIKKSLFEVAGPGFLIIEKPSPALERAAKRALHTLWKRGEIGRIRDHGGLYLYMPIETWNEGFSPKALAELKEALERLGDAERAT